MMGAGRSVFRFFNQYSNMRRKAEKIKNDEERRSKSCSFAIRTIFYSIFAFVLAILGGWLFSNFDETSLFIFILVISIGIFFCALIMFLWGLISFFFQLSINKGAWTWISLILYVASIGASLLVIVQFLNHK
ncbi:MAG: hypothetical protein K2I42_02505 [Anaeroplasmataceae bacterium]|nr:hypothetical protein [Anaeroplasmataceae bacterium]